MHTWVYVIVGCIMYFICTLWKWIQHCTVPGTQAKQVCLQLWPYCTVSEVRRQGMYYYGSEFIICVNCSDMTMFWHVSTTGMSRTKLLEVTRRTISLWWRRTVFTTTSLRHGRCYTTLMWCALYVCLHCSYLTVMWRSGSESAFVDCEFWWLLL